MNDFIAELYDGKVLKVEKGMEKYTEIKKDITKWDKVYDNLFEYINENYRKKHYVVLEHGRIYVKYARW